jgi:hypothetical protein
MSPSDQQFGWGNEFEPPYERPTPLDELKCLIRDLSLKEREFELIHPMKASAIEKIMQFGERAVEPLIEAFDTSDLDAKGWIIYLLGVLMDNRVIAPISEYFKVNEEEIHSSEADPLETLDSCEIRRLINEGKQLETRTDSEHSWVDDNANIREYD